MGSEQSVNAIKINNLFFYHEGKPSSTFKIITVYGFSIYCYLLIRQGQNTTLETTIKTIYETTKIATRDRIEKYLIKLHKKKMIKIHNYTDNIKIKYNQILLITVNTKISNIDSKYFLMSSDLFLNTVQRIKSYGWSLLCLLSMLHNYTYSSVNWSFGYANPSIKGMADVLKIGETTVKTYLDELEKEKLIKMFPQDSIPLLDGDFDNFNNHYIIQNRIPDNKYYIPALDKLINTAKEKANSA